jgi:hypothetical protein
MPAPGHKGNRDPPGEGFALLLPADCHAGSPRSLHPCLRYSRPAPASCSTRGRTASTSSAWYG